MNIIRSFLVLLYFFCGVKFQKTTCPEIAPNCNIYEIAIWNEPQEGIKELNILAGDGISFLNYLPNPITLALKKADNSTRNPERSIPSKTSLSSFFSEVETVLWQFKYGDDIFTGGKVNVHVGAPPSNITIDLSQPFLGANVTAGVQLILVNPTQNPLTFTCTALREQNGKPFFFPIFSGYQLNPQRTIILPPSNFVDIWNCSTNGTESGRLLMEQAYPRPAEYVDVSDPFVGETVGDNCTSAGECGSQYTGGSGCGSNGKCGGIGAWCFYDSVKRLSRRNIRIYCDKATTRNLQYQCAENSTCVEYEYVPSPTNDIKTRTVADSNGVTRTESYIVTGPTFSGVNTQEDIIRTVYEEIPWAISFFGIGLPMFTACCFIPCVCVCYKNRER